MWRFTILSLFLLACSGSPLVPGDVLQPDKMQRVLYDIIRADELVDFMQLTDTTYRPFQRRTSVYDTVFQLHAISKNDFKKSLTYYQGRPDLMKEMLDGIHKKITDTTTAVKAMK